MKNCILITLLLLTQLPSSFSQSLLSEAYGSSHPHYIYDSQKSADGSSYFIAGASYDNFENISFLLKMDSSGNAILKREYVDNEKRLQFERLFENSKGELILTGTLGGASGLFLKSDAQGNVLQTKRYKLNGDHEPTIVTREVVETTDHGYAMIGYAGQGHIGWNFMWLRVDSTGNPLYHHIYGNGRDDYPIALFNDNAQGFYVVTRVGNDNNNDAFVRVYSLDSIGNIEWSKNIVPSVVSELSACTKTPDGSYLLTGNGIDVSYLMKLNSDFDVLWIRYYTSSHFQSVSVSKDSSIWLSGRVWGNQDRNTFTKLTADGDLLFSRKITDYCTNNLVSSYSAIPRSNMITLDAKNIFTGYVYDCSNYYLYSQVGFFEVNENGELNCTNELIPVTQLEAPVPEIVYQQIDYTDSIDLETYEESVQDYMPDTFNVLCDITNEIPGVEITAFTHVYPNPASGQLNIDLPVKATSIYILNGMGQQVFLSESGNHMQIDCTSWAKGIYWLLVTGNSGVLFKEPFILN